MRRKRRVTASSCPKLGNSHAMLSSLKPQDKVVQTRYLYRLGWFKYFILMAISLSSKHTNCLWEKLFALPWARGWWQAQGGERPSHGGCCPGVSSQRTSPQGSVLERTARPMLQGRRQRVTIQAWQKGGRHEGHHPPMTALQCLVRGTRVPEHPTPAPLLKYSPTHSSSQLLTLAESQPWLAPEAVTAVDDAPTRCNPQQYQPGEFLLT